MLQRITVNLTGGTRYDEMSGNRYLVAPMVMLTEGVHRGSGGSLFYPKEELSKTPQVWNHKPVIVYHPQAVDGSEISACDPDILSNRQIGVIMNTRIGKIKVNNKMVSALRAEAWLNEERINKIDERITQAVEKNEMMELSTGLYTDNEVVENGEWNGEKYDAIARNYRPDHLALLPDLKGACSIEDGAGFLRLNAKLDKIFITNKEMSHGNIRSLLNSWLQNKGEDVWVEDVYDNFFIYSKSGKLFKGVYSIVDNAIEVVENFEEVIRVTEYRTKDGQFVGNQNKDIERKEIEMQKNEVVDKLIKSNSNSWAEEDRKALLEMDDSILEKMESSEKIATEKAVENATKKSTNSPVVDPPVVDPPVVDSPVADPPTKNVKPKTVEDYISDRSIPQEIRNVMRNGVATYNALKTALIKRLTDHPKNLFTPEQLQSKDNDELKQLVALATPEDDENEAHIFNSDFSALGLETNSRKEEPMLMQAVIAAEK